MVKVQVPMYLLPKFIPLISAKELSQWNKPEQGRIIVANRKKIK